MAIYNNPAFAQAAAEITKAFAPPSGADAHGWAAAKAKKAEAARLAEAWSNMTAPDSTSAIRDRFGIAAGLYNPTGSYHAVDSANATSRANNAATNATNIQQSLLAPVGAGQTRF